MNGRVIFYFCIAFTANSFVYNWNKTDTQLADRPTDRHRNKRADGNTVRKTDVEIKGTCKACVFMAHQLKYIHIRL